MGDKVQLNLLDAGDDMSLEDILAMFKSLTGRDPTQQEIDDLKKAMEEQ